MRERETERRRNRWRTGQNNLIRQRMRKVFREGENPSSNEEGRQKQAGCRTGAVGTPVGKADSL